MTRDGCHEADSDLHRDPAPRTPDHSDGDYGDVSHELTSLSLFVYKVVTNDVTKYPMMGPIVSEAHPELTEEMSWLRLRRPAVRLSADCCSSIQC